MITLVLCDSQLEWNNLSVVFEYLWLLVNFSYDTGKVEFQLLFFSFLALLLCVCS